MAAGTQVASLFAKIGADAKEFNNAAGKVKTELNTLQRGFQDFGSIAADLGKKAAIGVAAIGVGLVGLGAVVAKTGVQFNAMKEQAQISFTTMLGSGEKAKAFLDDLQKFAASTPFEFPELVQASQRLLAMGIAAQDVKPMLTAVGDAVAALGGTSETVNRVTIALGQMSAKGKVSAEEMMQLTEAGIPAWDMLASKIGVSIPEAMKMATKGSIDAGTAIGALVDGMNERFGGLMEKQSQTWNGLISTLKDNFAILSGELSTLFFVKLKGWLKWLVDATSSSAFTAGFEKLRQVIDGVVDAIDHYVLGGLYKFGESIIENWDKISAALSTAWTNIQNIIAVLKAIVSPLIDAIGKFISWKDVLTALGLILGSTILVAIGGFIAAMWPVIALVAQVTAAVAALRWAWTNDFMGIRTSTENTLEKIHSAFKRYVGPLENLWRPVIVTMKDDATVTMPWIFQQIIGHLKWWWMDTKIAINNWVQGWKERIGGWKDDVKDLISKFTIDAEHIFNTWYKNGERELSNWVAVTKSSFRTWVEWQVKYFKDALTAVQEFRDKYFAWFRPEDWSQMGQEWMRGLWGAVVKAWDDYIQQWRENWQKHKDDWDAFWGSHSPSKWFYDRGAGWMEGLSGGIESGVGKVTSVIDKLNQDVQDGLIQSFEVFENNTYRILQLSGNITKGVIENGKLMMKGWEEATKAVTTIPVGGKAAGSGPTAAELRPSTPGGAYDISHLTGTIENLFGASKNTLFDMFAGEFFTAIKGTSMSGAAAQAVNSAAATVRNSESAGIAGTGITVEKLLAALNTLIVTLQQNGLGNKFNVNMAPTGTGNSAADLRATVEYLQALYA